MSHIVNISQNIKILSGRIETEVNRLSNDQQHEKYQTDSLVYIGNWQDAIPRSIWTDPLLSDIDVRSWGIIRTQAVQGSAVMLSLNNLLKEARGYSNATVSRILYVLRLTRWISLCSTLRSETGTFRGNIYAIHDSPVSLDDAIYLDGHYLSFLEKQTSHNNKTIKTLAQSILSMVSQTIEADKEFLAEIVSEKTIQLNQLINTPVSQTDKEENNTSHVYKLNMDENHHVYKLNMDAKHHVQILNVDSEKKEVYKNQTHDNHVQKLNVVYSSSSSSSSFNNILKKKDKETTTTNSAGIYKNGNYEIQKNLIYPKEFNDNEIVLSKRFLQLVETDTQQDYLDELGSKIKKQKNTAIPIGNNIAMLSWLCKEHAKGNICLTSAYMKHREQRERKLKREENLRQRQRAITETALKGGDIKSIMIDEKENISIQKQKKPFVDRWEGMSNAVRAKKS